MVHVAVHPEEGRNVDDGTRWAIKREKKFLPGHVTEFSARTAGWGENVDIKAEQERIDKARKILKRVMSGKTKDKPWMMKPESILSTWCKRAAAMAAIYSIIVEPFCAGFDVFPPGSAVVFFSTLADLVFFSHMVCGFITGYPYKTDDGAWKVEMRHDRVAWRYVTKGSFLLDLITCLPVQLLLSGSAIGEASQLLRIAGFAKGLRVLQMHSEAAKLLGSGEVLGSYFGEARACVGLFVLCHWVACAWFWTIRSADEVLRRYPEEPLVCVDRSLLVNASVGDTYLCGVYWSSQTMALVGYGDLLPTTEGEVVFTMGGIVGGACALCVLMGTLQEVWMKRRISPKRLQERVCATLAYLQHWGMGGETMAAARSHSKFLWDTTRGYRDLDAVRMLPLSVQIATFRHVCSDILRAVDFLCQMDGEDDDFWKYVIHELRSEDFVAGSWVYREGSRADSIYIVKEGSVDMVHEYTGFVFETFGRGGWFGETSKASLSRKCGARAAGHCTLLVLSEASLLRLSMPYPLVMEGVYRGAIKRIRKYSGLRWRIVWEQHRDALLEMGAVMAKPMPPWPFSSMDKYRRHERRQEAAMLKQGDKRGKSKGLLERGGNFFERIKS